MTEALKRIITIDDEEDTRRTIKRVLEKEGYVVDEASDATEGWMKVSGGGYDLVLLDIMMPGTTPSEFIRYLRGMAGVESNLKKTKVLFLSAIPLPDSEKKKIIDRQVIGYLEKPFTREALASKVREALNAVADDVKPVQEKLEPAGMWGNEVEIEPGFIYLIKEECPNWSVKLFTSEKDKGREGLIVTRTNPEHIKKEHDLDDVRICWLTEVQTSEDMTSLSGLQELSILVNKFIEENNKSVILLDGLEYLITNNGLQHVLKLIQHLEDRISTTEGLMIVPVKPDTICKRDLALLERDCKVIG
jgi:CheY-like chemotaxis protein